MANLKIKISGRQGDWMDSHYTADDTLESLIAGFRDHMQYRRKDLNYDVFLSADASTAPLDRKKTLAELGIKDGMTLYFVDREPKI